MDLWLLRWLNDSAGWGYWPDYVAWFFAEWGLAVQALFLLVRWIWPGGSPRRERHAVLLAAGGAIFAVGIAQVFDLFQYRHRPYMAVPGVFDLLGGGPSPAFPSEHGSVSFTISFLMGWESRTWAALNWPVSLLIAWGRVWAGVHYPSDMLGALGVAFLVSVMYLNIREELEPALDRIMAALPQGGRRRPAK